MKTISIEKNELHVINYIHSVKLHKKSDGYPSNVLSVFMTSFCIDKTYETEEEAVEVYLNIKKAIEEA